MGRHCPQRRWNRIKGASEINLQYREVDNDQVEIDCKGLARKMIVVGKMGWMREDSDVSKKVRFFARISAKPILKLNADLNLSLSEVRGYGHAELKTYMQLPHSLLQLFNSSDLQLISKT